MMTNKEKAHELLFKHGGKIDVNGDYARVQIGAAGLADLWADEEERLKNFRSGINAYIYGDKNTRFSGGSVRDFKASQWGRNFDTTSFLSAQTRLGKIREQLAEEMREINPVRQRVFTETDGDIDFDRRWELKPYLGSFRAKNGLARTLRVEVEFAFKCGVSASEISAYGATAWAVCDAIESAGISCEIVLLSSGKNRCSGDFKHLDLEVTVKRAGEYIETLELARRFRADFYRRAMFALYKLTGDLAGGETGYGLGSSQNAYRLPPGAGTFRMCIHDSMNFKAEKAIESIKNALGIVE